MSRIGHWVLGVAIALTGVAIARLLAPAVPADYNAATVAVGIAVAIAGVLATARGAGRR